MVGVYLYCSKNYIGVPSGYKVLQNCLILSIRRLKILGHEDRFAGALALVIFTWVFLMNFMDLIPIDLILRFHLWCEVCSCCPNNRYEYDFCVVLDGVLYLDRY